MASFFSAYYSELSFTPSMCVQCFDACLIVPELLIIDKLSCLIGVHQYAKKRIVIHCDMENLYCDRYCDMYCNTSYTYILQWYFSLYCSQFVISLTKITKQATNLKDI